MIEASVRFDETSYPVRPGERLTFGRATDCTVCLDPEDTTISRRAGALEQTDGVWFLTNLSQSRALSVIDEFGLRTVLPPQRRISIDEPVWVVVDGGRSHRLRIEVPARPVESALVSQAPGDPTAVGEKALVSEPDRAAMVALFAAYLEDPPRSNPQPTTYEAAALRLGWPRTTLLRRIEHLRDRLAKAGVPNMHGATALTNLAEYALSRRLITKADLRRFRGQAG